MTSFTPTATIPMSRFSEFIRMSEQQRTGAAGSMFMRQPSWVRRFTTLVFIAIIAIPMLLLLLLAIVVSAVVFFILAAVASVFSLFGGSEGRQNVRIRQ